VAFKSQVSFILVLGENSGFDDCGRAAGDIRSVLHCWATRSPWMEVRKLSIRWSSRRDDSTYRQGDALASAECAAGRGLLMAMAAGCLCLAVLAPFQGRGANMALGDAYDLDVSADHDCWRMRDCIGDERTARATAVPGCVLTGVSRLGAAP